MRLINQPIKLAPQDTSPFDFFLIDITYHNKFINDENSNTDNKKLFKAMLEAYIYFDIW